MSAFDSELLDRHALESAPGSLCDGGGECASIGAGGAGADAESTVRTEFEPNDTLPSKALPDAAAQMQRWLAFLAPRFACAEPHSSTHASWVFRGVARESKQAVAVKLLKDSRPESRNAFSAEALLLSQLEHPGIVRYMAHGELAEGGAYIVTEWLEGE